MIISETVLRNRIRGLLLEAQVRPLKLLLKDIQFHSNITDEEMIKAEKRLRNNWDRGYSKYSQVIKNDVMNNEPIDHILDAIDSFMPHYSRVGPQMQAEIGRGDLTSSNLRGYVEGQASDKLNKTRTSQRIACRRQVSIREGEECQDFKVIHADSKWVVVYPKTMLGSMSWAVGLADGAEEQYRVDSSNRQVGRVGWCTASYVSNRFSMYAGNMHMYYFVKNSKYDISDKYRRLCVTWSKDENTGKVQIQHKGNATVDANNVDMSEEKMLSLIGQELVEKMRVDASSRKATSLAEMASKVTLPMVKQDIVNLKDDPDMLNQQLEIYAQHAKDDEVIRFFASYEDSNVRLEITSRRNLPEDLIRQLAKDESEDVRVSIASRSDLPKDLVRQLAQDEIYRVREAICNHKDLTNDLVRKLAQDGNYIKFSIASRSDLPKDLVRQLAQDESYRVREIIASRKDLSEDVIRQLAKDESNIVRGNISRLSDLSEDVIRQLAKDESNIVRASIARRSDLPEDLVRQLAQDESADVRSAIALCEDFPEDVIRQLAKDESNIVRASIARRSDLPEDIVRQLAQDENSYIRKLINFNYRIPVIVGESTLLRNYINMLLS